MTDQTFFEHDGERFNLPAILDRLVTEADNTRDHGVTTFCRLLGRLILAQHRELDRSRQKNTELNRRCQQAEKATPEYARMIAIPPDGDGVRFVRGSLGRALLALQCNKQQNALDEAVKLLTEAKPALHYWVDEKGNRSHPLADRIDAFLAEMKP